MADNMNDIIRRGPRRLALPLPAREPEQPTRIDLGAGPRAPLARTDTNEQMRRWLADQYHRTRPETVTVEARRPVP
jgi:hypothetical protein